MSLPRRARCGRVCSAEVSQDIAQQLGTLLRFLGGGFGLGLLYDLLRPPRRMAEKGGAWLDVLFCAAAAAAVFCLTMTIENAHLGGWELIAALAGFCIYINSLSRLLLPIFDKCARLLAAALAACKKIIKNTALSAKSIFQKW